MEHKIITSGERIKTLRKKYKLNQQDLAGDAINRTLLSYIENDKIKLTEKTAKILVENINELSQQRDLGLHISIDDIMMDVDAQIQTIVDKFKEELRNLKKGKTAASNEYIKEIEEFLFDKNIPYEKGLIYELIGDTLGCEGEKNLFRVFGFYIRSFEFFLQSNVLKHLAELSTKIASNRNKIKDYKNTIKYTDLVFSFLEEQLISTDTKRSMHFYIGGAYSGLNDHPQAITHFEKALSYSTEDDDKINAKIMINISHCYKEQLLHKRAIEYLEMASKIFEAHEDMSFYSVSQKEIIANTLIDSELPEQTKKFRLERLTDNLISALKYVEPNDPNIYMTYVELGKSYYYFGNNNEAINYLKLAVNNVIETDQVRRMSLILLSTMDIMVELSIVDEIFDDECLKKLCSFEIYSEYLRDTIFKLMEYFMVIKNYEKVEYIIANVLDKKEHHED